jgi:hypothetical protein
MRLQLKREWVIPASVGVASFVAGIGAGYYLALSRFKKVDARLEELESERVQLEFKRNEMDHDFNMMVQQCARVVREMKEHGQEFLNKFQDDESILLSRQGHPSFINLDEVEDDEEEASVTNIFPEEEDTDWDYEEELASRRPDVPYIIHRDEYFGEEMDCVQTTITYYAGDNILCDERDTPIYNPEKIVGTLVFGHGSNDPNVVYVRNETLQAEYEVLLDQGHYMVEVLGQSIDDALAAQDLKHSKSVQKFRPD